MKIIMKNVIVLAALALAVCGEFASGRQTPAVVSPDPNLRLLIDGPQTVKAGSKIVVRIATTNISGQIIGFRNEESEFFYEAAVRDALGRSVPETEHGMEVNKDRHHRVFSGLAFGLNPKETIKDQLEISSFYDMSRPGKYEVRVSCRGAKSNTITINVVQ